VVSEIRDAINRLLWDDSLGKQGEVVYVNRCEQGVVFETVKASDLTDVSKNYFKVGSGLNAKYIPYHRVVEVRYSGGLLWKSKKWNMKD